MAQVDTRTNAEISHGTTVRDNGRVNFALFAPGKKNVDIIGDFNDWKGGRDSLEPTPEGLWQLEKALDPGTYRYQFIVDNSMVVADPYARSVEWADPPRSIVEVGQSPHAWQHDDWARPFFQDLILYEAHIGDFTPEGTYNALTDRLDYLRDLGVNALQLMPVTQGPPHDHWGYEPAFFFAAQQKYGSPDDLRRLIDEAHGKGIAIVFDIVLAHSSGECPLAKLYLMSESPWYGHGIGGENEFGFPTFDHRKPASEAFARDVQTFWLREFHADGFRYDYIKNIGFKEGYGAACLVGQARKVFPEAYLIGEHLPEAPDRINSVDLNGSWHNQTSRGVMALLTQQKIHELDWNEFGTLIGGFLDPVAFGYERATQLVNYIESHDEERIPFEVLKTGVDDYGTGLKAGLGATVLFMMPGEPMIYMGGEWGENTQKTLEPNPLHWEMLESDSGRGLHDHYRCLAQLRRDHPALRTENYRIIRADSDTKTLALHRWNDQGDEVIFVANFQGDEQTVPVPFPTPGRWHEVFGGTDIETQGDFGVKLAGYGAAVFVRGE